MQKIYWDSKYHHCYHLRDTFLNSWTHDVLTALGPVYMEVGDPR